MASTEVELKSPFIPLFQRGKVIKMGIKREKIFQSAIRKRFCFLFPSLKKHALSVVEGRG
jgi:hypothetical protein